MQILCKFNMFHYLHAVLARPFKFVMSNTLLSLLSTHKPSGAMADFCAYLLCSKCMIKSWMLIVRDARGTELLRSYNYRFGVSHKGVVSMQQANAA